MTSTAWSQRPPEEVLAVVAKILEQEFQLDASELALDTRFSEDLDFDSIDAIDLAVRVEEEVGLKVEEERLAELHTLGDVVALIQAGPARP